MAPPHEVISLLDSSDDDLSNSERFPTPSSAFDDGIEALSFDHLMEPHQGQLRPSYQSCLAEILKIFPDISHEHVQKLYDKRLETFHQLNQLDLAQEIIEQILDGGAYPKEKERQRELKRKREHVNSDEEEAARWKLKVQNQEAMTYSKIARLALNEAFPIIPSKFIRETFDEHRHYYGAFFYLDGLERTYNDTPSPPYTRLKARRVSTALSSAAQIQSLYWQDEAVEGLKQEIEAACERKKKEDQKHQIKVDEALAREAVDEDYRARGEVMECACCFDDATIQNITHCNGEIPHFFCHDCARSNANNDIGNSRYELRCMDGSGCKASFSRDQRGKFLDKKTFEKLERLQQQAEIRLADLANLTSCPFCDFVAICPPVDIDKEFHCGNPECEEVSCRLCKAKSHIPQSCAEFKKETGVSQRRIIEEARTEALLRTCGKCKVRILKEDGCNKVVCTSCSSVLCDYCGKDITGQNYTHFDGQGLGVPGAGRGGGKCPLYDESHNRKDEQVEKAEKEALERVRRENPEISEDDLKIKFAKEVQKTSNRLPRLPQHFYEGHWPHDIPLGRAAGARIAHEEPGRPPPLVFHGIQARDVDFDQVDHHMNIGPERIQRLRAHRQQADLAMRQRLAELRLHQEHLDRQLEELNHRRPRAPANVPARLQAAIFRGVEQPGAPQQRGQDVPVMHYAPQNAGVQDGQQDQGNGFGRHRHRPFLHADFHQRPRAQPGANHNLPTLPDPLNLAPNHAPNQPPNQPPNRPPNHAANPAARPIPQLAPNGQAAVVGAAHRRARWAPQRRNAHQPNIVGLDAWQDPQQPRGPPANPALGHQVPPPAFGRNQFLQAANGVRRNGDN